LLTPATPVDPGDAHHRPRADPGPTADTPSAAAASNTTRAKFHNAMQDKIIEAVEPA
jgi:hypothetical protein